MVSFYQVKNLLIAPTEKWANGRALYWDDWSQDRPRLGWKRGIGLGQLYYKLHQECTKRGWVKHDFYHNTLFYDRMQTHWHTFWPELTTKNGLDRKLGQDCDIPRQQLDFFITQVLIPSLNDWRE